MLMAGIAHLPEALKLAKLLLQIDGLNATNRQMVRGGTAAFASPHWRLHPAYTGQGLRAAGCRTLRITQT